MGKGGGGTTTSYTTNIPSYAKPYVKTMLGATQKELFNMNEDNEITGFKEYKPYSTDPNKYVAGFSPMQEQAMRTAASPEAFGQQVQGYMSPYMQNVVDIQKREAMRGAGILGAQQQAQATNAGAFGGYREGIQRAENQRNLSTQMNDIQLKGQQMAFDNAQQQARMSQGQQMQYGGMQQQQEQQKINQAIQDYANAQQYPLMQLGTMSNMLRGLPMQAQNTNQYVAQPLGMSQVIGGVGAYSAGQKAGLFAEGGAVKSMAEGGIASVPRYDVGGEVESQLESMDTQSLAKQAQESSSPTVRHMAQRILRERQMEGGADQSAAPAGPMGIDYQAPEGMAGGGIIAFAEPTAENNQSLVTDADSKKAQREADRKSLLAFPAALADVAALPVRAGMNALGGITAGAQNVGNRVINAIADTDLDTNKSYPVRSLSGYYDASQKANPPASKDTGKPQLLTAADVAARTPEQKAEQARLAAIYEKQRSEGITGAPVNTAPAKVAVPAPAKAAAPAPAAPAPAKAAAPAPAAPVADNQGIVAAAPTVDANGKPVMPDFGTGPTALNRRGLWLAEQQANRSDEDYLREIKEGKPDDKAIQEYRKEIMAERANSAAENQRQSYMRQMQFFAKWGSTPGPVLAAGLKAMDATLPDMIADQDKFKKAKRELDKAIFDIDNSMRLEELGDRKEARSRKDKSKEHLQNALHYAGQAETSVYATTEQAKSSKYVADKHLEGQRAVASANAGSKQERASNELQRMFSNATTNVQHVQNQIAKEKTNQAYLADKELLSFEPKKMSPTLQAKRAAAKANVEALEAGWKTQLEEAVGIAEMYRQQAMPSFEKRGVDTSKVKGPPAGDKTMTRADIEATAKSSGKSVKDVEAAAKAGGYTIKS